MADHDFSSHFKVGLSVPLEIENASSCFRLVFFKTPSVFILCLVEFRSDVSSVVCEISKRRHLSFEIKIIFCWVANRSVMQSTKPRGSRRNVRATPSASEKSPGLFLLTYDGKGGVGEGVGVVRFARASEDP